MRPFAAILLVAFGSIGLSDDRLVVEWTLPAGELAELKLEGKAANKPLDCNPKVVEVRPGQKATVELIREVRYPKEFDPAQVVDLAAAAKGEGGVLPQTPTAFETTNAGWTISFKGQPGAKLITIVGEASYTSVEVIQAVHGEGAGPILREYKDKRGKKQTELISPNVGKSGVSQTTTTNFQVYATPGKVYQIPVRRGGKVVQLEMVCGQRK
jgi:hypothetical protein